MFNNVVNGANSTITNQSNITITNSANGQSVTRPQSVWYTVSASGQRADGSNTITQAGYTLTQDETNNIFAIIPNKIPGALNSGDSGVSIGNGGTTLVYTTAIWWTQSNIVSNCSNTNAIAVASP